MPVYDDEKVEQRPGQHDDLDISPEQRDAEIDDLNDLYNEDEADEPDLQSREEDGVEAPDNSKGEQSELDKLPGYFKDEEDEDSKEKLQGFVKKNRKKLIGGGAIGGGIIGLVMSFVMLLPLKVQHMVENLQQNFFASSEQATEDMSSRLLRAYVIHQVMPGMIEKRCTTTLTSSGCVAVSKNSGPIGILFNAWRDARLEEKLAKRGIVIERRGHGGSNNFRLITPSTLKSDGVDLGNFDPKDTTRMDNELFKTMDRGEVRREVRKSFENESFAKRMFYRYKVGRFMERKHGVVRCLVACDLRDSTRASIDDKKLAWKTRFIDRVIEPRHALYGAALKCAIEGFKCSTVPGEAKDDGTRETELEETARTVVQERNSGTKKVSDEELKKKVESFQTRGLFATMISDLVGDMMGSAWASASKFIPVFGVVLSIKTFWEGIRDAGPAMKHLNYVINSQAMVTTYMMYRSHADEIKDGSVDPYLVGSVADSLGPTAGTDQNGGPAESSPYYNQFMGGSLKKGGVASILNGGDSKVYAASSYKCNTKDVYISNGVCPELDLSHSTGIADAANGVSEIMNNPIFSAVNVTFDILNKLISVIGEIISKLASLLKLDDLFQAFMNSSFVQEAIKLASKFVKAFAEWFVRMFINDAVGNSPSGGRMFDLAAGGADVSGNTYAHYGLGGKVIGAQTAENIRNSREQERLSEFENQTFFARMFDTSSNYSLVTQASMALPTTGLKGLGQTVFGSITNPLGMVSSLSLGGSGSASAATTGMSDLFGVAQYGYDANDPVFTTDPEKYWTDNKCDDPEQVKKWGEAGVVNPDTGIPENNQTFGCKLLETTISASGAYFTDKLLTADELGEVDSTQTDIGEEGQYNIATYNVRGASHTDHGGGINSHDRMKASVQIIRDQKMDVVGLQEFQESQRKDFLEMTDKEYGIFPTGADYGKNNSSVNSIIWLDSRFELLEGGTRQFEYFQGIDQIPWVKLKDKATLTEFIVTNTHDPADTTNNTGVRGEMRLRNAQRHVDFAKTWADKGLPVFITGDFNSKYSPRSNRQDHPKPNLPYCVMTQKVGDKTLLALAEDAVKGDYSTCPRDGGGPVDWVVVTHETVKVTGYKLVKERVDIVGSEDEDTESDHNPIIASVLMGAAATSGVGTAKMGDDYAKECGPMKAGGAPGLVCDGECVDFVKFRLKKHIDKQKFVSLGNGKDVAAGLTSSGYKVNHTPAVNSVVSWPAGGVAGANGTANATYGHTAMVSAVYADGSITVEEYNYPQDGAAAYTYGQRKIPAATAKLLTYAHTEVDFK